MIVSELDIQCGKLYAIKKDNKWILVEFLKTLPNGRHLVKHRDKEMDVVELYYGHTIEHEVED